jgi:hypothetical protein
VRRAVPLIVALAALVPAPAASALITLPEKCIDPAGRSAYVTTRERGAPYEVLGRRADLDIARRVKSLLVTGRTWTKLRDVYGNPPPRFDGAQLPWQIFVVPDAELAGDTGAVLHYCGKPRSAGVVISNALSGTELTATTLHELFHVFQGAAGGRLAEGNWWTEATAAWYEHTQTPDASVIQALDVAFLGRPQIPLDTFDPGGDKLSHHYGAWRFVDYVLDELGGARQGEIFLIDSFRRLGRGAQPTDAVIASLAASGLRRFPDLLGQFWGAILDGRVPERRPRGRDVTITEGTSTVPLGAQPLAAGVVSLQPAGGVRQITVSVSRPDPDTRVWAELEGRVEEWSNGVEVTFCVGSDTSLGEPWPIRGLHVVATNGSRTQPNAPELRIEGSSEPCTDLGVRLDRTGCRPIASFRPPRGYTEALVFEVRLYEIVNRVGLWRGDIFLQREPAVREFTRYSRLMTCMGQMLSGLRAAPQYTPFLRETQARTATEARAFLAYAECLEEADRAAAAGELTTCFDQFPEGGNVSRFFTRLRTLEIFMYGIPGANREWKRCERAATRARRQGRRPPKCAPTIGRRGPLPV